MFETLTNLTKSYSVKAAVKTNIIGNYNFGNSSLSSKNLNSGFLDPLRTNKLLSTYYKKFPEIVSYETTKLASTVVNIFIDYIYNYFLDEIKITFKGDKYVEKEKIRLNISKILKDIDLINEIKEHLYEVIYYGSYCIGIKWDKEKREWYKNYLENPLNVIDIMKRKDKVSRLVVNREGNLKEIAYNRILRIGQTELNLLDDISADSKRKEIYSGGNGEEIVDEEHILKDKEFRAGLPLFYYVLDKVKEYILKDRLISLLSIKDLLQPVLFLIACDSNTSKAQGNAIALDLERMINKYTDLATIMADNSSAGELMDSVINNVRVAADWGSAISGMQSIDLSKLSEKIDEMKNDKDALLEELLVSFGTPRMLFNGETTKWEALKTSERLYSCVNSIVNGAIISSVKEIVSQFYYMITKEEIPVEDIEIKMFRKTQMEFSAQMDSLEVVTELTSSISGILDTITQTMQNNPMLNKGVFAEYILNQLEGVDPEIRKFVGPEQINAYISQLRTEQEQGGDMGGGFGGGGGW